MEILLFRFLRTKQKIVMYSGNMAYKMLKSDVSNYYCSAKSTVSPKMLELAAKVYLE